MLYPKAIEYNWETRKESLDGINWNKVGNALNNSGI